MWKAVVILVAAVVGGARAESPSMPQVLSVPPPMAHAPGGVSTAPAATEAATRATARATDAPAARATPAPPEQAAAETMAAPVPRGLRMLRVGADHPSGIYYAKEDGKLSVVVENTGDQPARVDGQVEFGERATVGDGSGGTWRPLVVAPITPMELGGKQRAKFDIGVKFAEPGPYELRWKGRPVWSANGVELECIFPPSGVNNGPGPWVTAVPVGGGTVPGLLGDYARRTGVRRVVLADPWPTPVVGREAMFGGPLALNARQLDDLLADARAGGMDVIVRVTLGGLAAGGGGAGADAERAAAFHQHIEALVAHGKGVIKAIVIEPGAAPTGGAARSVSAYRAMYLAAYDAAKKQDKGIVMGGAGSAAGTVALLWGKGSGGTDMAPYVDAWVCDGTMADLECARGAAGVGGPADQARLRPVWVLPGPGEIGPAALLAEGAKVVPVWSGDAVGAVGDRGATAHLLGGAALFERVRPGLPPYIAVFQGDGYAVAAIAGLGAGTPVDAAWPGLAAEAGPGKTDGVLAVLDDTGDMRVVDEAGRDVDCRAGDNVNVPLDRRMRYVLQAGNAEDLAAVLRTATVKGLPAVEVSATEAAGQGGAVKVQVRNATLDEVSGTVKVVARGGEGDGERIVGTRSVGPVASGKSIDVVVGVEGRKAGEPLAVEVETKAGIVRVAVK